MMFYSMLFEEKLFIFKDLFYFRSNHVVLFHACCTAFNLWHWEGLAAPVVTHQCHLFPFLPSCPCSPSHPGSQAGGQIHPMVLEQAVGKTELKVSNSILTTTAQGKACAGLFWALPALCECMPHSTSISRPILDNSSQTLSSCFSLRLPKAL